LPDDILSESKILTDLYQAVRINRKTNKKKSRYGKLCNLFAAASLLGVVIAIAGSIYQQQHEQHATTTTPVVQTAPQNLPPNPSPLPAPAEQQPVAKPLLDNNKH
jgi:hypothetical protein